jgi:uncharacterized SAM-binding protein YcdF (DUF218 family)
VTAGPEKRTPSFWMLRLGVVLGLLYALGFGLFVLRVPPAYQPDQPVRGADGIVALTGGGGRLGPAVALLEKGVAQRLLITGVNPQTKKRELKVLLSGGTAFDCCADLGFEAADTHGNAKEAAKWTRARGYHRLIVVTSNDHMPRSLLEFSAQLPGVQLIPYAVSALQADMPLQTRLHRLNDEYAKFLASSLRIALLRDEPPHRSANRKS